MGDTDQGPKKGGWGPVAAPGLSAFSCPHLMPPAKEARLQRGGPQRSSGPASQLSLGCC